MGAFAVPFLVASTAMQAVGSIQQGRAADKAARYNAKILEQNAATELSQASEREDAVRRQAAMVLGKQSAAFAQSGGGMGGSAADVMQQSSTMAELDALTTRYEGALRAQGLRAEAATERYAGKQAKQAGYFNAANSILSGASAYSMYKKP